MVKIWLLLARILRTLPVAVSLNRLRAALLLLCLGITLPVTLPRYLHLGASTMVMVRPSDLTSLSTLAMSLSDSHTRFNTSSPSSGCIT